MRKQDNRNILFSCHHKVNYESEQMVREHCLVYVVSGSLEFILSKEKVVAQTGEIVVVKRNQLAKAKKQPPGDGAGFKSISLFIDQSVLRTYALTHNIQEHCCYEGEPIVHLRTNAFLKAYFASLEPYFNQPEKMTANLAKLKCTEAIELLIDQGCKALLFDFNEPHKIDLERYMLENFKFNIPLADLARLTGRSLSTFKRDFRKKFNTTPQRWLTARRLAEANFLIIQKRKRPSEIYYELGFENFSHFSKIYNRAFGDPSKTTFKHY